MTLTVGAGRVKCACGRMVAWNKGGTVLHAHHRPYVNTKDRPWCPVRQPADKRVKSPAARALLAGEGRA